MPGQLFAKDSNCIQGKAKVVSLFKNPYPKAFKNSFFWRQQGFPPASSTANNYKPAGGHTIKNLQLSQGSFFPKDGNCIQSKAKVVSSFKNPYPKAFKNSFFWRQQGFPPARCTANNYKPAGRHTIKNLQLSQGSFFPKDSNCIQSKAKLVSLFKNPYPKAFKNSFFWRQQGFPPARCTANNCKPAGRHTIKNLQLSQGSFFPKDSNCIQSKAKLVSLL